LQNGAAGNPYRRDDEPHKGAKSSAGRLIKLSDEDRRKFERQRQGVMTRLAGAR
jgi:hypothetical protein